MSRFGQNIWGLRTKRYGGDSVRTTVILEARYKIYIQREHVFGTKLNKINDTRRQVGYGRPKIELSHHGQQFE